MDQYFPDQTPQQCKELDAQFRLLSWLKVTCAPAVAKGIPNQLMVASINGVNGS